QCNSMKARCTVQAPSLSGGLSGRAPHHKLLLMPIIHIVLPDQSLQFYDLFLQCLDISCAGKRCTFLRSIQIDNKGCKSRGYIAKHCETVQGNYDAQDSAFWS